MKQMAILVCMIWAVVGDGQDNTAAQIIIDQGERMEKQINKVSIAIKRNKSHNLYLNTAWQNSAVVSDENQVTYFNGRFNVLNKSIELKNKNGIRSIRPNRVEAAMVGNRYFTVVPADQIRGEANSSFFEVLALGEVNLYALHLLKTRMTGSNSITTAYNGEKEYYIGEQLYYHKTDGLCQELKVNKKNILRLFGDRKDEVEVFRRDKKLKYKSKEDLIQIFEFYNSLIGDVEGSDK